MRHCDDYIDDEKTDPVLRAWLFYHRLPAGDKRLHNVPPTLYATTIPRVSGVPKRMPAGRRVELFMASRFGDVGIGPVGADGYDERVGLEELKDFGERP